MSAVATPRTDKVWLRRTASFVVRDRSDGAELPDGVCGEITCKFLTYGVEDAEGTMFAPGCLDRTKNEKVAAGKVPVFKDHKHDEDNRIGLVRSSETVGNAEIAKLHLYDTPAGREAKEKFKTVAVAGGFTGYSVGVLPRKGHLVTSKDGDGSTNYAYAFDEAELMEVSTTPLPAVPGTGTIAMRSESEKKALLIRTAENILTALGTDAVALCRKFVPDAEAPAARDAAPATPAADSGAETKQFVSRAERLAAVRRTLQPSAL